MLKMLFSTSNSRVDALNGLFEASSLAANWSFWGPRGISDQNPLVTAGIMVRDEGFVEKGI